MSGEDRYARQIAVPAFGERGQHAVRAARVAVVGAGGLAATAAPALVGAGIGRLTLFDGDRVDRTNLHRQVLFREEDAGRLKAEVAVERLSALNPEVELVARTRFLEPDGLGAELDGHDLVLDCADRFSVSYSLSDYGRGQGVPLVSASVTGLSGYAGAFCGAAPSLHAVFPDLPVRAGSCASEGVLGPVVGLLGNLQAQMTLGILAGLEPSPLGQLVTVEAPGWRFGGFRFDRAPEPEGAARLCFLGPAEIREEDFVLDVRGPQEGPALAPQAVRIPWEEVGPHGPLPGPGQRAVIGCCSGVRAQLAARRLARTWQGETCLVATGPAPGLPA